MNKSLQNTSKLFAEVLKFSIVRRQTQLFHQICKIKNKTNNLTKYFRLHFNVKLQIQISSCCFSLFLLLSHWLSYILKQTKEILNYKIVKIPILQISFLTFCYFNFLLFILFSVRMLYFIVVGCGSMLILNKKMKFDHETPPLH